MRWVYLLGLLNFSTFCFAQNSNSGSIKGTVTTSDGQPAQSVSVIIKNTRYGTITDENGNFEFRKITPGNYTVSFSLTGFASKEQTILVREKEAYVLNLRIEQTYAELQIVIITTKANTKYVETEPSPSLRIKIPLNEIPQNVTVITRQLLIDQGAIKMSDALRTVSAIQKNQGDLNDIVLNFRGSESFLNIFRNGLGGHWWNQQEDIAMIEKIEFIKGTAGFIVNNFPPGGFINMVTKQPQREPIASVNAEYGSFNLFRLTTDWGGAFSKKSKLSYRFNAGLHTQNRAFQFSNASRYFICGALKYEPDKKNTITAEYNYMWGKTSGNNVVIQSLNGKMFSLPRNFAVADSKTDNLTVSDNYFRLLGTHTFNNNWSLGLLLGNINGKWGQGYQLNADVFIPVSNDTLYRNASFDDFRNLSRVAQVYLNGKFYTGKNIEHKTLAAIDYNNVEVYETYGSTEGENFGLFIPSPNYYIKPDSLKNFLINTSDTFILKNPSIYFEDHIKIKGKLIVTLAGRFSHQEVKYNRADIPEYQRNITFNHFTPRFGLSWLFSNALTAYAVYDEFFFPIHARTFDHKPLKPLTGYNIEAGLKSCLLDKKLSMNLSAYHMVTNNALEKDPLHPDDFIQTGQIIQDGIDFDMTGNITSSLVINANYAFAHARISKGEADKMGRKKIGTPDHCGNLWLNYKLLGGRLKGFSFGLGYQYMGKRSALSYEEPGENVYLPVYNLFDAALNFRNEKFTIGLNIYNITNTRYATIGIFMPSSNEWRYTPGEPVNFRLSFGVNLRSQKKR